MDVPGWVAILTTIGGVFGGTFGAWLIQLYKEKNANKLATEKQKTDKRTADEDFQLKESEQAFRMYKEIVDSMKKDMSELQTHMKSSDKAHLDCREENAILKSDIRIIRHELETVRASIGMKPSTVPLAIDGIEDKVKENVSDTVAIVATVQP